MKKNDLQLNRKEVVIREYDRKDRVIKEIIEFWYPKETEKKIGFNT